jgi:hypothetical protein
MVKRFNRVFTIESKESPLVIGVGNLLEIEIGIKVLS